MKLRVIEVKERVPKEDCNYSPPDYENITHYVPQYFDYMYGWCKIRKGDPSHPMRFRHLEDAIAVCKEYAAKSARTVVWCEDIETNNYRCNMSKKRVNKCQKYDEHWGCAISPSKRCDSCGDAIWEDEHEAREEPAA